MSTDKKMMYRGYAQTEGMTITVETSGDVTIEKARRDAEATVVRPNTKYEKVVLLPIGKKEDYDQGIILFCPRCGKPVENVESSEASVDCYECGANFYAEINVPEKEEGE